MSNKYCMFPGQGSQKTGMGAELFDQYKDYVNEANQILGFDIKDMCLSNSDNRLDNTQFTQPALYLVSAMSFLNKKKEGEKYCASLGHSLGEYTALFAAGVFDLLTGLKMVKKRGEIMAKAENGAMAAVIGLEDIKIKEILESSETGKRIDVANYNSPGQVVISGLREDITACENIFKTSGAKMYIPLKVSGAFHSRYMRPSADEFELFIKNFSIQSPAFPVYSNVTGLRHEKNSILENLVLQMTSPVRWVSIIQNIKTQDSAAEFVEIGPGNVLTGLVKRIK